MTKDEALDKALEALENCTTWHLTREQFDKNVTAITAIKQSRSAPVQERCKNCDDTGHVHDQTGEWRGICKCEAGQAIEATPPAAQRQWVGLSEEEIDKLKHLIDWTATWSHGRFAYEIEQLLKEKNA